MLYFIVNEKAQTGKGALLWAELEQILEKKKIEYIVRKTQYEKHAIALSKEICNMEDDDIRLVVVGGDGTINEVINGMEHFEKVHFGIISAGSGNDMARGLGIKGSPVEQLETLLNSKEDFLMDLGQVSWNGCEKPRLFAISSGVGMDALVCKKALISKIKKALNKIHLGKLTYIILTIQSLFSMKTAEVDIQYDKQKSRHMKKTIFSAAMNFRAEGGGVPMAPRADAQDGKLSVCTAHDISKLKAFFCLIPLVLAQHEKIKGFDVIDCETVKYKIDTPLVLHADGEYCGDVTEAEFICLPAKLRIMV